MPNAVAPWAGPTLRRDGAARRRLNRNTAPELLRPVTLLRSAAGQGHVVELKYFGGLEVAEVARVLDVSKTIVEREWRAAKAWLRGWRDGSATAPIDEETARRKLAA